MSNGRESRFCINCGNKLYNGEIELCSICDASVDDVAPDRDIHRSVERRVKKHNKGQNQKLRRLHREER